MAHESLKLIPGVDTVKTPVLNEAAISETRLVRFMPDRQLGGLVQKLGGWDSFRNISLPSPIRSLHAWADTNDNSRLAIGTANGVWTYGDDSGLIDRTLQVYEIDTAVSFSTTTGSSLVVIDDLGSNITSFDAVDIRTQVSVGGLILFGYYSTKAVSSDSYEIVATDILGTPQLATSTVAAGGAVAVFTTVASALDINVSLVDNGYSEGSTFTILVPVSVGGLSLYGNYTVSSIIDPGNFTISGDSAATSSDSISINNGNVRFEYYIGKQATISSSGFGDGGFGDGGFGVGVSVTTGRVVIPSSITAVGTIATATFPADMEVPLGTNITIDSTTPIAYNGNWIVSSSTKGASSTVSFDIGVSATPQTVAGTLTFNTFGFIPVTDWSLDNWGEDLIANPHMGPIYSWSPSLGSSYNRMTRLPNAPDVNEGVFVSMPQRQIVAYGSTFTGIQDPLLVRWCDVSDNYAWIATVVNQAGSYRISKGSKIVGGIQGPQQGILWTDIGVWSMQYIGPPYVYQFNELGAGSGLIGRKAMGAMNGIVYWMGQSQFYKIAGGWPEPLDCPVWDNVFQSITKEDSENIRCAVNSRFNEISWYYSKSDSFGEPTYYVKYNASLNQWDYGVLTRTAWIDQSVFGPPIAGDALGNVIQHEVSNDANGTAMYSGFTTGYFAVSEGAEKIFVDQVWPDMKWGKDGSDENAIIQMTFFVKDYPGDQAQVYGPYTITKDTEYITPRFRGRLVAIDISSSDLGSFWRLGNIRYRAQPDGAY